MPADKAIRQFTLLMLLHSRSSAVSRAEIFERLAAFYPDSDEARERMFERDKQDLRALGVVLDAVEDPFLDDYVGYKVNYADTQELRVQFTPDEAHAVSIAAKLWQGTEFEAAVGDATLRVQAVSDPLRENGIVGRIHFAPLPASIAKLAVAVSSCSPVEFDYRKPESGEPEPRRIQPWAVFAQDGHWLVVGFDELRQDKRRFRLDRITSPVRISGTAGSYSIPSDFDVGAEFDSANESLEAAVLHVRRDSCWGLRRIAHLILPIAPDWEEIEITGVNEVELAGLIASHAPDAFAVSPPSLVTAVRQQLEAVLETHVR